MTPGPGCVGGSAAVGAVGEDFEQPIAINNMRPHSVRVTNSSLPRRSTMPKAGCAEGSRCCVLTIQSSCHRGTAGTAAILAALRKKRRYGSGISVHADVGQTIGVLVLFTAHVRE